jgi:hypothetical protein
MRKFTLKIFGGLSDYIPDVTFRNSEIQNSVFKMRGCISGGRKTIEDTI